MPRGVSTSVFKLEVDDLRSSNVGSNQIGFRVTELLERKAVPHDRSTRAFFVEDRDDSGAGSDGRVDSRQVELNVDLLVQRVRIRCLNENPRLGKIAAVVEVEASLSASLSPQTKLKSV